MRLQTQLLHKRYFLMLLLWKTFIVRKVLLCSKKSASIIQCKFSGDLSGINTMLMTPIMMLFVWNPGMKMLKFLQQMKGIVILEKIQ